MLTAGLFLSGILPARAGDIGRVAMLKQDHKVPIASGVASIAAERALDVFSVLLLAIIGALWTLRGHVPWEWLQLMIGTGVLFVLAFVALLVMPGVEGWLRQPGWLWRSVPLRLRPLYQKIVDFGFALIHAVRGLGQKPAALAIILLESFVIWILDAVIVHTVLLGLGIEVAFKVSLMGSMVGVLATIAPIMPGALGQYEAGLIALLTLLGVPTAEASLAALVVRFISLWTFIPVSGLITYVFGFSRALNLNPKNLTPGEISTVTSSS
ncbi:MAG: lysylphosphatidylglycerol synthase transmembrane domain-containing protein [Anaerolineae bacterium]